MAAFLATMRLSVSGTRRSAKPATKDQIMSSAYDTPSAGPVSLKKSWIRRMSDSLAAVANGDGEADGVTVGEALRVAESVGDADGSWLTIA